jgi:thiazole/oxazole-forming peptide maturase SagD family component
MMSAPAVTRLTDILVDELSGPVHELRVMPRLKCEPDVSVAVTITESEQRMSAIGSGAGYTDRAAGDAALGEFVERASLASLSRSDVVTGRFIDLESCFHATPPPDRYALFSPEQCVAYELPYFDRSLETAWLPVQNLTREGAAVVPECQVNMGSEYRSSLPSNVCFAPCVSTGASTASDRTRAILYGLLECIERDAVCRAWRARSGVQRVALSARCPVYARFEKTFARAGLDYRVFQVPCTSGAFACFGILIDRRRERVAVMAGGAARRTLCAAVEKTLLELAQGLAWKEYLIWTEDANFPEVGQLHSFEDRARHYFFSGNTEAFAFLEHAPTHQAECMCGPGGEGETQALNALLDGLRAEHLDCLVYDVGGPFVDATNLAVVKVIVPGMEQLEGDQRIPFLGGQRWRDALSQSGSAKVNPWPHPYP